MYICDRCRKKFENQKSYAAHRGHCGKSKKEKSVSPYKLKSSLYKCECGREFSNPQSLNGHFSHCLIHRKGIPGVKRLERGYGWNRGLTKDDDMRIKNSAESFKKNLRSGKTIHGWKGKAHSPSTRERMSEKRKKYLENNPHIEWFFISNGIREIKVQGIWELKVAKWLNLNNIAWDRKPITYGFRRYTPDFYLINRDEYLEVKGWLKDRDLRKMFLVLDYYPDIKIRILEKPLYKKLAFLDMEEIPLFNEKYSVDDIDFDKFNDVWNL